MITLFLFASLDSDLPANSHVGFTPNGMRYIHVQSNPEHPHLLYLPGRNSFLERYKKTMEDLRSIGFNVWSMDYRGTGLSKGRLKAKNTEYDYRMHSENLDLITYDIHDFLKNVIQAPTHILGYSFSAHFALKYIKDYDRDNFVRSIILVAPLLSFNINTFLRYALWNYCSFMRFIGYGENYCITTAGFKNEPLNLSKIKNEKDKELFKKHMEKVTRGNTFQFIDESFRSEKDLDLIKSIKNIPVYSIEFMQDISYSKAKAHEFSAKISNFYRVMIPGVHDTFARENSEEYDNTIKQIAIIKQIHEIKQKYV